MGFLLKWLRPDRPSGVALHPSRTITVAQPQAETFERARRVIVEVLGGAVADETPPCRLEAAFGLVNSERLTIDISAAESGTSRVHLSCRRGAAVTTSTSSAYVERMVSELSGR